MKKTLRIACAKNILLQFFILSCGYAFAVDSQQAEVVNDGVAAFNEGHYQDAEHYFLTRLKEPGFKNEALIYLSRIDVEKGNTENAVKYIEQALLIEPTNVEELILSGDIYCAHAQKSSMFTALKMAKKCIGQYDAAVNADSENVTALFMATRYYLGAPSIAGGSTTKGNEYLARLSLLSPELADTYRVQLHEREGRAKDALVLADELSKKGFKSAENQYEIAKYYRDKKLYSKAKALFEPLLAWKKTQKNKWCINDSLLQLGEILIIEGTDIKQGITLIENYKKVNNNPSDVHYFWSTWSLAKGYKAIGEKNKYDELVKKIKSEDYKKNSDFVKEFESSI
jgi:tetratricopeptide (TPR) repeat protein